MSYILDALRRADAERERGHVPSIHSPPVQPMVDDRHQPSRGQPLVLVAVIVVLLLALAGMLAWHLMSGKDAAPATQTLAATTPVPDVPPTPPAETPAPEPLPLQEPPPVVQYSPAPAPAPAPMAQPEIVPQPQPIRPPPPAPRPTLAAAPPVVTVPARLTKSPPPAAAPQADSRIYAMHELPPNIQRELPKLVVGGAMYSEMPANRMLIINSQVFHEGDKLSSDLQLQEIKLKSAVLQYKGYRYGVSY